MASNAPYSSLAVFISEWRKCCSGVREYFVEGNLRNCSENKLLIYHLSDTLGYLSNLSCSLVVNFKMGGLLTHWVNRKDINHVTFS